MRQLCLCKRGLTLHKNVETIIDLFVSYIKYITCTMNILIQNALQQKVAALEAKIDKMQNESTQGK